MISVSYLAAIIRFNAYAFAVAAPTEELRWTKQAALLPMDCIDRIDGSDGCSKCISDRMTAIISYAEAPIFRKGAV